MGKTRAPFFTEDLEHSLTLMVLDDTGRKPLEFMPEFLPGHTWYVFRKIDGHTNAVFGNILYRQVDFIPKI